MNKSEVKKLIKFMHKVDSLEAGFDLISWYADYPDCGTTACIAGHIAANDEMAKSYGLLQSVDEDTGKPYAVIVDLGSPVILASPTHIHTVTCAVAYKLDIPRSMASNLLATNSRTFAQVLAGDHGGEHNPISEFYHSHGCELKPKVELTPKDVITVLESILELPEDSTVYTPEALGW